MCEDIVVEKADLRHASSLCKAVDVVACEQRFLPLFQPDSLDCAKKFIQVSVEKNYPLYYAIKEDEIVAWCDIIPKPYEEMKHVGTLYFGMISNYRGNGIGSELMKKALAHAKTNNQIERVELEVLESNRYGIELCKSLGFSVEGKKQKARKIGKNYDNVIVMGKLI